MKLMQINLNHCQAAQDLLKQSVRELMVDIALLSEPYRNFDTPSWVSDSSNSSAIWSIENKVLHSARTTQELGFVRALVSGITIYSCYIPPRYSLTEFQSIVDNLTSDASNRRPLLIAGDFNAWATEWGCRSTNTRGRILLESLAALDVMVLNSGNEQTFYRNSGGSIIDIAFASGDIFGRIKWYISDQYTHSDHHAIIMEIEDEQTTPTLTNTLNVRHTGWKPNSLDKDLLNAYMEGTILNGTPEDMADQLISQVTHACNVSMRKRGKGGNKPPVYWWNEEIAEMRRDCIRARRTYVRTRGRPGNEQHHREFKFKRKALKLAIRRSKRICFNDLIDDVENNPFGMAYKIVTKKLNCLNKFSPREPAILDGIVKQLFPRQNMAYWENNVNRDVFSFPSVTSDEIMKAVSKFDERKAPGLDGISNLVLKEVVMCCPNQVLGMLNDCLKYGSFPSRWKRQRLVLLPKDNKPLDDPSSYRPLCMIDTFGKLLESIICNRLDICIETAAGLSDTQYGFRKRRSTIDAIKVVVDTAKEAIAGESWTHGSKEYCVVVTLDVKNAFNTANWERIVDTLDFLNIPQYLLAIIKDYFRNRILVYDTNEGRKEYEVTGGVPQGSVLGPLLWNVMYDGVLRLNLPDRAKLVGFADDIALVVVAKYTQEVVSVTNSSIKLVQSWLSRMGLTLAEHKTEAVLITGRKTIEHITLNVGRCEIVTKKCLKYLGVMIDNRLSFKKHLEYVETKARKTCTALCRIMPNTRGPKYLRRRILAGVVKSVILYAAPIWAGSTKFKTYRKKINSVYRLAALRVCCAFRTVSDEAAFVIAGMMPVDLQAREAERVYASIGVADVTTTRNTARSTSISEWQTRWTTSAKGRWTHRLIPNINIWLERKHGDLNYYLTQFLSGHGCFKSYLHKFRHDVDADCPVCGVDVKEDPEHVFFNCPRFSAARVNVEQATGSGLRVENIIQVMLSSAYNWECVCNFVRSIIIELREQEEIRRRM